MSFIQARVLVLLAVSSLLRNQQRVLDKVSLSTDTHEVRWRTARLTETWWAEAAFPLGAIVQYLLFPCLMETWPNEHNCYEYWESVFAFLQGEKAGVHLQDSSDHHKQMCVFFSWQMRWKEWPVLASWAHAPPLGTRFKTFRSTGRDPFPGTRKERSGVLSCPSDWLYCGKSTLHRK